jgi:transposase
VLGKSDPNAELLDAAALCRHLVPEDSMHAFLADHRRELFPDELFADLFPSGLGRPSVPADVVATVMVLQALEGLSDRDAAAALRTNIAWKVAAGLALGDAGIHYSVLTYWRTRLRNSESPERVFDAVRAVIDATGVLTGRRRRALDSTLLDDAVATQDTVTQLISAIRRVRRLVPEAAAVEVGAHDYDASGKPVCAWMTLTPKRHWSPDWSTTPGPSSPPSTTSPSMASRPRPSACWRWLPARTSNPATARAPGGSPNEWPPTE